MGNALPKECAHKIVLSTCQSLEVDKHRVSTGFDKAASSYNALASVQQTIAGHALDMLEEKCTGKVHHLADIGCGTAASLPRLTKLADTVLGVDISLNMLKHARTSSHDQAINDFTAINGDAESLPIQTASMDIVYSSMALQWCESPQVVLAEIQRVLKPNGKALLCILAGESFSDLTQAWQLLNSASRVNKFHSTQTWLSASETLTCNVLTTSKEFISEHDSVIDMLSSIKRIGANTRISTVNTPSAYMGKHEIEALTHYFVAKYGEDSPLPLRYQLLCMEIAK